MNTCNTRRGTWRLTARISILAVGLAIAGAATAQTRPVRFIVPYGTGSGTDTLARAVAAGFEKVTGQGVIIENKPGAGNVVAIETVLSSPPDGRTVLVAPPTLWSAPLVNKNLKVRPLRDFAAVTSLARGPYVVLGSPKIAPATLQELVAYGKENPGKLNAGNNGMGGSPHLMTALFATTAGIKVVDVPFLSNPAVATALVAGDVHFYTDIPIAAKALVDSGRVRGLAVSGATRDRFLPNVPTFLEAGFPGLEVYWYIGLVVPATTPPNVVNSLSVTVNQVLKSAEMQQRQATLAFDLFGSTPEQFTTIIRDDTRRWQDVVDKTGIKIE